VRCDRVARTPQAGAVALVRTLPINAGIKKPNPGDGFVQLRYAYAY
jgi:hypothetical protein